MEDREGMGGSGVFGMSPDCMAQEVKMDRGRTSMRTYIGTKIIKAMPMDSVTFKHVVKREPTRSNEHPEAGYMVTYRDGYTSWSPKEEFELAYREITPQERTMIR